MMRQLLKNSIILAAVLIFVPSWSFAWEYPLIKGYGPMDPLPNAAVQPDKSIKYKVIFEITRVAQSVDKVNPGLDRVARFLNVMAASGIMPKDMELAAVIHGPAAPSVLKNEIFKGRFKMDNPNEKIIRDLKEAGVKLYVCGQSLADNGFEHKWVNEQIAIAVAALVVVPTYQLKGYAYQPFF
jgi:intracellular sulfur oxidation DsrE/DsrF family protein